MKILVTGSEGFIGKNLVAELRNRGYDDILEYDLSTDMELLDEYTRICDFIFHLAGVNRPKDETDFMIGNYDFTAELLALLKKHNNKSPILISSSIRATRADSYGKSKKAGEELIFNYGKETDAPIFVYRLPNVFGKWCRPNYNSVVATFCHNIAHGLPIQVNDEYALISLVYIDDVIHSFIDKLENGEAITNDSHPYINIRPVFKIKLGEISSLLYQFKGSRETLLLPDMGDDFTKKLYSTYLSYLPITDFSYPLKMNADKRGAFVEFIKSNNQGQVSINITKPHAVKGNHWHHTKNEKFLVVSGRGVIRFRQYDSEIIHEYPVSGDTFEVVDIPTGYIHQIENTGDVDMIMIIWANELFDKEKPDTYFNEI